MNTIFHVLDEDLEPVVSILFKAEPLVMLGSEPVVGTYMWIKVPMQNEEMRYEIVGINEENDEDHGLACALRLKPKPPMMN